MPSRLGHPSIHALKAQHCYIFKWCKTHRITQMLESTAAREEALERSRRRKSEQAASPEAHSRNVHPIHKTQLMQTPIRGDGKHQLIVLREQGKRKMSSALSFALPLKSLQINGRNGGVILGKQQMGRRERRMAMAAQGSDSLDHLQRAARYRQHRQQPHPKQRIAAVAPFGLWDRFPSARTVQQMMETMERIMEDPLGYPSVVDESGPSYRRGGRTPWEIKEDENEYKMRFDMPGMTKTDVKVSLEEKTLVIQAEKQTRKSPEGEEQEDAEEWPAKSYGRYSSRIGLPENIEMEKIKAEVRDGVLYVTIPKAKTVNKVLDINVQ